MGVLWNVLNKALKENANALISEYIHQILEKRL